MPTKDQNITALSKLLQDTHILWNKKGKPREVKDATMLIQTSLGLVPIIPLLVAEEPNAFETRPALSSTIQHIIGLSLLYPDLLTCVKCKGPTRNGFPAMQFAPEEVAFDWVAEQILLFGSLQEVKEVIQPVINKIANHQPKPQEITT